MKVLITGAKGFVGKNLVEALKNIRDGKNTTSGVKIDEIFEYDRDTAPELLDEFCEKCDFVFNLAGVNRPKDSSEFMKGNFGFASTLLDTLKKYSNTCPVMLSSSIQASLVGRYAGSEYGKSKLEGEKLFFDYSAETGAEVLVYRFPNLFGKWCRPNYNSVIATWCYNIANDLEITVDNPDTELELCYIDDVVDELIGVLKGEGHRCKFDGLSAVEDEAGKYYFIPTSHHVTLGEIADLLKTFSRQPITSVMPECGYGSFEKKLFATYLSYLPREKMKYSLDSKVDERGSFTELIKTAKNGQFSVNISKPGITKGEHWHNTKWEIFVIVKGHGLIKMRDLNSGETYEFEVSGDKMEAVYMVPGFTHAIINLSDTEEMVTFMWANELFDPKRPDTYREEV